MCHFKTITVPVIVGALGMIKKGTARDIYKINGGPSQYEIKKKLSYAELLVLGGGDYQCDRKLPQNRLQKDKFIKYIYSLPFHILNLG